jgi:hypothetical protein
MIPAGSKGYKAPSKSTIWWLPIGRGHSGSNWLILPSALRLPSEAEVRQAQGNTSCLLERPPSQLKPRSLTSRMKHENYYRINILQSEI